MKHSVSIDNLLVRNWKRDSQKETDEAITVDQLM